ncbi:MAG: hypothetical protein AB7W59_00400 [Acidimicrobiia bacterium]
MDHLHPSIVALALRSDAIEAELGDRITPAQAEAISECRDHLVQAAFQWGRIARGYDNKGAGLALRASLALARSALRRVRDTV